MKVVILRLDLDRYEIDMIERLLIDRIISFGEVVGCRCVSGMNDYQWLMWVRKVQHKRDKVECEPIQVRDIA